MQNRLPISLGDMDMSRIVFIAVKEEPKPFLFKHSWHKELDHQKRHWMRLKADFFIFGRFQSPPKSLRVFAGKIRCELLVASNA